ncbi:MAG: hypothetical protein HKN32_07130, partial [Flavobacteriales bacterium]|nr:hypothetical protein [Flavobacteriales bacterium]
MKRIGFVLLIIPLFLSCQRQEGTRWTTNALFPVTKGSVSLSSLVGDSLIQPDDAGILHLIIEENLTDFDLDSLVAIPDTTVNVGFEFPLPGGPFSLPPGTEVISLDDDFDLNTESAELREVLIKSGTARYQIRNYINGQINLTYTLPGA